MIQYLKITIPCPPKLLELLIAELGQIQYDSFQELEESLEAYIEEQNFDEPLLKEILDKYQLTVDISVEKLENTNWNEEWEKNFDPVYIDGKVQIRAVFHEPKPGFDHEIVIDPKMAFGTGHHETTHLIVAEQLQIDHKNKQVLDVGTGTGILAIMAHKLGAQAITATDIDDWCIDNSKGNFALNGIDQYDIWQGTIDNLTLPGNYDIIFANINKNVLLAELPIYSTLLSKEGILVLSGFYTEDIQDLQHLAQENGLDLAYARSKNNWAMMRLSHRPI